MFSQLTYSQRQIIEAQLRQEASKSLIARMLGVHRSTITKEVERNSIHGVYLAQQAQILAEGRCRRDRKIIETKGRKNERSRQFYQSYFQPVGFLNKGQGHQKKNAYSARDKRKKRKRNFFAYYYAPSTQQQIKRMYELSLRKRMHWQERFKRSERSYYWKYYCKPLSMMMSYCHQAPYRRLVKHPASGFVKGRYLKRIALSYSIRQSSKKNFTKNLKASIPYSLKVYLRYPVSPDKEISGLFQLTSLVAESPTFPFLHTIKNAEIKIDSGRAKVSLCKKELKGKKRKKRSTVRLTPIVKGYNKLRAYVPGFITQGNRMKNKRAEKFGFMLSDINAVDKFPKGYFKKNQSPIARVGEFIYLIKTAGRFCSIVLNDFYRKVEELAGYSFQFLKSNLILNFNNFKSMNLLQLK